MGHGTFRSRHRRKGVNRPLGITTLPLRSAEGVYHPPPRHHRDPLTSEHHAERARPIEQRYRHRGRTDRKASVRPSIDRNSCGGDKTHTREQDIGVQPLRHSSEARRVEVCLPLRWGRGIGGRFKTRWALTQSFGSVSIKDQTLLGIFLSTS